MIFSLDDVDLNLLSSALAVLAELDYVDVGPGQVVAEVAPEALEQARRDFVQHVYDSRDRESALRTALAWLLNQDDERLKRFVAASLMPFPVGDIRQKRQFLESLWVAAFADWRAQGAGLPEDLVVQGPGA